MKIFMYCTTLANICILIYACCYNCNLNYEKNEESNFMEIKTNYYNHIKGIKTASYISNFKRQYLWWWKLYTKLPENPIHYVQTRLLEISKMLHAFFSAKIMGWFCWEKGPLLFFWERKNAAVIKIYSSISAFGSNIPHVS